MKAVTSVTKSWTKQRKAEERRASRRASRLPALKHRRTTIKSAAWSVMKASYLHASSNGTLPAHARQIFYAARKRIQDLTSEILKADYFTQTLLPEYMAENPSETAKWDVVFDARGHLLEPHAKDNVTIPLGTIDVRRYIQRVMAGEDTALLPEFGFRVEWRFPTRGPGDRFGAILFIEKEGFFPLFDRVGLAARYDIALMSTKGMSVTAARQLVDEICGTFGIPLVVLHDFDKAGFSICQTVHSDTRRYAFRNSSFPVIDMGLRLEDIEEWDLPSESVLYQSDPTDNLIHNGATEQEVDFLYDEDTGGGERVELNAFASGDLIQWIEGKLQAHGIGKVIPAPDVLLAGYRRSVGIEIVQKAVDAAVKEAKEKASMIAAPPDLDARVRQYLEENPELPWDMAIHQIVRQDRSESNTES